MQEEQQKNWQPGFWGLIATQFQGAFNENGLKYLVIFLIIGNNLSPDDEENKVLLVGSLFALPFILFSMTGGFLADRFSKRSVTIWTKLFEIAVMLFAVAGFALHNLPMSMAAVFLASTQGALFGPSKYGLLPEILPEHLLSWGNGVIELGTFLAIISGSVVGGFFSDAFAGRQRPAIRRGSEGIDSQVCATAQGGGFGSHHAVKYVCTVYSAPGTEYAPVNSTPTAILISTSSASGSIHRAGETSTPLYPCTTGFSSVPMPSILISTMSLGWSVKLLSGTMPVPVSRKAPWGNELSRPSQPIRFSKVRAI
jgi:MFS family permease